MSSFLSTVTASDKQRLGWLQQCCTWCQKSQQPHSLLPRAQFCCFFVSFTSIVFLFQTHFYFLANSFFFSGPFPLTCNSTPSTVSFLPYNLFLLSHSASVISFLHIVVDLRSLSGHRVPAKAAKPAPRPFVFITFRLLYNAYFQRNLPEETEVNV